MQYRVGMQCVRHAVSSIAKWGKLHLHIRKAAAGFLREVEAPGKLFAAKQYLNLAHRRLLATISSPKRVPKDEYYQ